MKKYSAHLDEDFIDREQDEQVKKLVLNNMLEEIIEANGNIFDYVGNSKEYQNIKQHIDKVTEAFDSLLEDYVAGKEVDQLVSHIRTMLGELVRNAVFIMDPILKEKIIHTGNVVDGGLKNKLSFVDQCYKFLSFFEAGSDYGLFGAKNQMSVKNSIIVDLVKTANKLDRAGSYALAGRIDDVVFGWVKNANEKIKEIVYLVNEIIKEDPVLVLDKWSEKLIAKLKKLNVVPANWKVGDKNMTVDKMLIVLKDLHKRKVTTLPEKKDPVLPKI